MIVYCALFSISYSLKDIPNTTSKSNLYIDLYNIQWIRYSGIIENCSKFILECPTFEFLGQETGN